MPAEPRFKPNEAVYYRESAALGHLEPAWISGVTSRGGEWIYSIANSPPRPSAPQLYGDRRSFVHNAVLYWTESELCTYCEALALAEAHARAALDKILQLKSNADCN